MSKIERLAWLERWGEVPDDADLEDWRLAQHASWWGKKLDPVTFWKERTIWCDQSALSAAQRHGRTWPPMPYHDGSLPIYPNDEGIHGGGLSLDGIALGTADCSEENAFWQKFNRTHPRPPADIERKQIEIGEKLLKVRQLATAGKSLVPMGPEELARIGQQETSWPIQMGYPPEAFSEKAWFWAYVRSRRLDYQGFLNSHAPGAPETDALLREWPIQKNLVTEPLTEAQIREADAWKSAYIRRLRREKTDESYINAYLQAWNLSAQGVFGGTDR